MMHCLYYLLCSPRKKKLRMSRARCHGATAGAKKNGYGFKKYLCYYI